jgi:hypothetical protein
LISSRPRGHVVQPRQARRKTACEPALPGVVLSIYSS